MIRNFEGVFEVFDHKTPPRREKIIQLILEMPENTDIEKELVDFRGEQVKVFMNIENEKDQKMALEDIFEFWMMTRPLKNGNKLRVILTAPYDKPLEKKIVGLKYHNVNLNMETIDQELDFTESHPIIGIDKA